MDGARRRSVLIADGQPSMRAGIRSALEQGGFNVCAEVADAHSAIAGAQRLRPDVVLIDIDIPTDGVGAISEIRRASPGSFVVVLTSRVDERSLFRAIQEGADGYLLKDTDPVRLPLAIHGVFEGEAALPRRFTRKLIEEFRSRSRRPRLATLGGAHVDLTSREWEILELLEADETTDQISKLLGILPVTVRTHISSILKKLEATDRAEAVEKIRELRASD